MKIKPKIIIGERPKGNVYFCSDLHFCHANAIIHGNRPFRDVDEMNSYILKVLKETLTKDDIVFDLGDLFWKADYKKIEEFVSKIPCDFYHIQGNHDNENVWKFGPLWEKTKQVGDLFDIHVKDGEENYSLVLTHFPILSWGRRNHGSVNIHGHCHGNIDDLNDESLELRMDIGFDSKIAKQVGSFLIPWEVIKSKIDSINKLKEEKEIIIKDL